MEPRVWVRYRPLLPLASPDETEERNRAWNAFLTELDDRWIPWRFAGVEETPQAGTLLLDPENPFPGRWRRSMRSGIRLRRAENSGFSRAAAGTGRRR
ncbi:MAG: hypothetical protein L6W00_04925 [Lentisphaeria bacterium]|nr:MAG: hypothetical protein L6W00_04925 [Lentisphaeria bacterium]